MNLLIEQDKLIIELDFWEKLWSLQFHTPFAVPLAHIQAVSTTTPQSGWSDWRLPGTHIPGVIKAGTYYSDRGREFWYVTRDRDYLTLELQNEFYKRIILTVDDHQAWQERFQQMQSV